MHEIGHLVVSNILEALRLIDWQTCTNAGFWNDNAFTFGSPMHLPDAKTILSPLVAMLPVYEYAQFTQFLIGSKLSWPARDKYSTWDLLPASRLRSLAAKVFMTDEYEMMQILGFNVRILDNKKTVVIFEHCDANLTKKLESGLRIQHQNPDHGRATGLRNLKDLGNALRNVAGFRINQNLLDCLYFTFGRQPGKNTLYYDAENLNKLDIFNENQSSLWLHGSNRALVWDYPAFAAKTNL
jgi:hypothetical protein